MADWASAALHGHGMRLTTTGSARNFGNSLVGRITAEDLPNSQRDVHIRLLQHDEPVNTDLSGYRAVLAYDRASTAQPVVDGLREVLTFADGDVVVLEPNGFVRSLYRPREKHHSMFVTERCSSNCLMCSQPPKDHDDVDSLTARNRELIRLMNPQPEYLTITGGEPTLLGDHLLDLLDDAKRLLPCTTIHILSNGRTLAWPQYCARITAVGHPDLGFGIPLYSDVAGDHDYVVQAKGAFDQTVAGFHQAARHGIRVEVRIVLHRLTVPRLTRLAEFIFRNLSFVEHVALMGLEFVGYTARNIAELWIDPFDYQSELAAAVEFLSVRGMTVSIYNHQLCVLRPELWRYARKSISDWKNLYLPACQNCSRRDDCGGLFQWAVKKHSNHIHTI
jgi:His-Xaa-Ser system radical SAM maturase HxsC